MTKAKILNDVMLHFEKFDFKEDDSFDTRIFYYLCGRYPDLSIRRCVEIVEHMRKELMAQRKEGAKLC